MSEYYFRYSVMLKCWEVDAKRRLGFREIVDELSKLINLDDGYYVLDNKAAVSDDAYIIDDPTVPPNADNTTTFVDDYVNPTPDADLTKTPDDDYVNA